MNVKELFDLSGKVAVVTGGYTGIGRQMAEGLAEAGANLVLCARNYDGCVRTAGEIQKATDVEVLAVKCDVTDENEVKQMIGKSVERFGTVDILINNAGIAMGSLPEETTKEDWQQVIDVNLTGMFLCSREAGKIMIKNKSGKIINISSIMGFQTTELVSALSYVTSKGGVIAFTKELAVRWIGHNINVNSIAPGWFPSNMTDPVLSPEQMNKGEDLLKSIPARRFGGHDDLKGVTVLLSSGASDYMVGETILVDGGASVRY